MYYRDNFLYLVDFVQKHSFHLLDENAHQFIKDFRELSVDGQCVYIRLINRKGPYFRFSKFFYDEIEDIPGGFQELELRGFISDEITEPEYLPDLFRKEELVNLFPEVSYARRFRKEHFTMEIVSEVEKWESRLLQTDQIIKPARLEELDYIKMLFFGHYGGLMTDFVVRDIGNVRLEKLDDQKFKPWFSTIEVAKATYEASRLYQGVKIALKTLSIEEIDELLRKVDWPALTQYRKSQAVTDKLLLKIAWELERNLYFDAALHYYQFAGKHPSRERQIRILDQQGKQEKAQQIAIEILEDYRNAEELLFAKDFLQRTGKRINRTTTQAIANAPEVALPSEALRVERQVLRHFAEQGYDGLHSENYIWRSTFGLTFWDLLYDQEQMSFHNPLQRQSDDLYTIENKEIFLEYLNRFGTRKQLKKYWQTIANEKFGINNPFVYWHSELIEHVETLLDRVPFKAVKNIMITMTENLRENSKGFPDLFVWNDTRYHFYEVKSPNDHLSPQQLFWIDRFRENKIKCDILRVRYTGPTSVDL